MTKYFFYNMLMMLEYNYYIFKKLHVCLSERTQSSPCSFIKFTPRWTGEPKKIKIWISIHFGNKEKIIMNIFSCFWILDRGLPVHVPKEDPRVKNAWFFFALLKPYFSLYRRGIFCEYFFDIPHLIPNRYNFRMMLPPKLHCCSRSVAQINSL